VPLPSLTRDGELPPGVHRAALREVLEHFGARSRQRMAVAERFERIYRHPQPPGIWSGLIPGTPYSSLELGKGRKPLAPWHGSRGW
jgi:hypothetical protein